MRTALLNGRTKLKQTAGGLKLTSASGKQTFYEAAIYGSTGGKKNLYLIDTAGNYIMGINKPIDRLSRCMEAVRVEGRIPLPILLPSLLFQRDE